MKQRLASAGDRRVALEPPLALVRRQIPGSFEPFRQAKKRGALEKRHDDPRNLVNRLRVAHDGIPWGRDHPCVGGQVDPMAAPLLPEETSVKMGLAGVREVVGHQHSGHGLQLVGPGSPCLVSVREPGHQLLGYAPQPILSVARDPRPDPLWRRAES
jgi:hypothetical protein